MASGDSAFHIGSLLTDKGYSIKHAVHFVMMNNFHIPKFKFYPPKNDYRLEKRLQKTFPKVEKLAEDINSDRRKITGNNPVGHLLGGLQRKHIDQVIEKLGKELTINEEICIKCGKCARICPTHNISKKEGLYQFGDNCALCLRCYSQCPVSAILIGEGSKDTNKYPRYKGPGKTFNVNGMIKK